MKLINADSMSTAAKVSGEKKFLAIPTTATTASTNFSGGTTTPRKMTKQEFAEKIRLLRLGPSKELTSASPSSSTATSSNEAHDVEIELSPTMTPMIDEERKAFEEVPDDDEEKTDEESLIVVEPTE